MSDAVLAMVGGMLGGAVVMAWAWNRQWKTLERVTAHE